MNKNTHRPGLTNSAIHLDGADSGREETTFGNNKSQPVFVAVGGKGRSGQSDPLPFLGGGGGGMGGGQLGHEQVWPLALHCRWNAPVKPVLHPLGTAALRQSKQICDPGRAAKGCNQISVRFWAHTRIKHHVYMIVKHCV